MKVDAQLKETSVAAMATTVARQESVGYAGVWTSETSHDPFLPLAIAAEHSERVDLGTAVAVAFARNPMSMAYTAHDLQLLSGGRFNLGLGSQVSAHIQRRFSMPWGKPAERMREYVTAMRAIWACWNDGVPLNHAGSFYEHNLMMPMFAPQPSTWGAPRVHLAAVGERMVGVAGEVADGLILHSFSSTLSIREHTFPALGSGLVISGRTRADIEISIPALVATGADESQLQRAIDAVRARVAFYASTPSYRWLLELHDLGALGDRLIELSRSGGEDRWTQMSALVDDDTVELFAVVAPAAGLAAALVERYATTVDRLSLYAPYKVDPGLLDDVARQVAVQVLDDTSRQS